MDLGLTYEGVVQMYSEQGYRFYNSGPYNINIFGIRKSLDVDLFNDLIAVAYLDEKCKPHLKGYTATTDPGRYWLKNKLGNINGTFVLKKGNYPKCFRVGKHKGFYDALIQSGDGVFRGYRDFNGDGELDMSGPVYTDVTGLNLHTTSHLRGMAEKVGAYSSAVRYSNTQQIILN